MVDLLRKQNVIFQCKKKKTKTDVRECMNCEFIKLDRKKFTKAVTF